MASSMLGMSQELKGGLKRFFCGDFKTKAPFLKLKSLKRGLNVGGEGGIRTLGGV